MNRQDQNGNNLPFWDDGSKTAGQILVIETGCHSSRDVMTVFRVIKDIDPVKVAEEYYASNARPPEVSKEGFVLWLTTSGYVEEISWELWNIGSYDLFD